MNFITRGTDGSLPPHCSTLWPHNPYFHKAFSFLWLNRTCMKTWFTTEVDMPSWVQYVIQGSRTKLICQAECTRTVDMSDWIQEDSRGQLIGQTRNRYQNTYCNNMTDMHQQPTRKCPTRLLICSAIFSQDLLYHNEASDWPL